MESYSMNPEKGVESQRGRVSPMAGKKRIPKRELKGFFASFITAIAHSGNPEKGVERLSACRCPSPPAPRIPKRELKATAHFSHSLWAGRIPKRELKVSSGSSTAFSIDAMNPEKGVERASLTVTLFGNVNVRIPKRELKVVEHSKRLL